MDSNLSGGSRYPPFEQMGPGRLLRSSYQLLLSTPKFNLKTYGGRSFTINTPSVWNAFPFELEFVIPFLLLSLCIRLGFLELSHDAVL